MIHLQFRADLVGDVEFTPDPGVIGQASFGFFVFLVLILWSPVSAGLQKFHLFLGTVEDMVD